MKHQGGLGDGQGGLEEHHHGDLVGDPQLAGNENCCWVFATIPARFFPWAQTLDGLPVLALCVVVVGGGGGGYVVDVDDDVVDVLVALVIVAGVQQDDWFGASLESVGRPRAPPRCRSP